MKLDWLIVGGGIHGVHIAARLIGEGGAPADSIRILDPADRLFHRWRACTATTGMSHLRSPSVHHVDLDPMSLQRYAGNRRNRRSGTFRAPYDRPALNLFDRHCDHVVETLGIAPLHISARATSLRLECGGITVETDRRDPILADNVVLAMGSSEQPLWPEWAPRDDQRVRHVFEPSFDAWPQERERVAVVGGGISAIQIALRLAAEDHDVHVLSRHPLRVHQFDSDPGWLGPKFMVKFARERDFGRRRSMINEARHRGSVPPELRRTLSGAVQRGEITWVESEVVAVEPRPRDVSIRLAAGGPLQVDRVLLATGFARQRPGGAMVDDLVAAEPLPCAECGYPIVDSHLRWHPRIHVTGPLAELELGPASRNIAGARHAGDRLLRSLREPSRPRAAAG